MVNGFNIIESFNPEAAEAKFRVMLVTFSMKVFHKLIKVTFRNLDCNNSKPWKVKCFVKEVDGKVL